MCILIALYSYKNGDTDRHLSRKYKFEKPVARLRVPSDYHFEDYSLATGKQIIIMYIISSISTKSKV